MDVQGARVKSLEYPDGEVLLCGTLLASKWAFVCYLFISFCPYVRVFMLLGAPGLLLAMSLVLERGDFVPMGFCACALVDALEGCGRVSVVPYKSEHVCRGTVCLSVRVSVGTLIYFRMRGSAGVLPSALRPKPQRCPRQTGSSHERTSTF